MSETIKYEGVTISAIPGDTLPDGWQPHYMMVWGTGDVFPYTRYVVGRSHIGKWIAETDADNADDVGFNTWDYCAEIPVVPDSAKLCSIDVCIDEMDAFIDMHSDNRDFEISGVLKLYSSIRDYLKLYALLDRRINRSIKLIHNDQAYIALDTLRGESDDELDAPVGDEKVSQSDEPRPTAESNTDKYRPYKDADEFLEHWRELSNGWPFHRDIQTTMGGVWLITKACDGGDARHELITGYDSTHVLVGGAKRDFDYLFNWYSYNDGTPFGMRIED